MTSDWAEGTCSHFTAWSYETDGEVLWSWSCDCGGDGTAGKSVSLLDALDGARRFHDV